MGSLQAPTIVLHPSGTANGTKRSNGVDADEEMDDATFEMQEDENDLVEEGLEGMGEVVEKGLDEED